MGAVATIFSTLTGTWALPKHVFITQNRETELCLSHDLGSLRGVFSLKTRHSNNRWLPLHTMQLEIDVNGDLCSGLRLLLCCVFAANAFEATFDLVTELMVSSLPWLRYSSLNRARRPSLLTNR